MQSLGEPGIIGHKNEVEIPATQMQKTNVENGAGTWMGGGGGGRRHGAGGANSASASRARRSIALAPNAESASIATRDVVTFQPKQKAAWLERQIE